LLILKPNKWIVAGVLFALLWSSASTATKLALSDAQPLVIAEIRFMIAGILILSFSHLVKKAPLPSGKRWKHLIIYGLLNVTIYLGCYVIAMQYVTAGIGALAVATNPIFISFLSVFLLKKKLSLPVIIAILLGTCGVIIASWPLLQQSSVTTAGLLLILFSMLSYSAGAIYFSAVKWNNMDLITINGWQTFLGGLFLLPFTLFTYHNNNNQFTISFWISVMWLAVPVSIFAVQLWLWLLKTNTVKAGLWLFLCPVFGLVIAAWLTHDIISIYTIIGVLLVITGLFIAQKMKTREPG
jgi:drug/metabolite transporter (DMT)-like permease